METGEGGKGMRLGSSSSGSGSLGHAAVGAGVGGARLACGRVSSLGRRAPLRGSVDRDRVVALCSATGLGIPFAGDGDRPVIFRMKDENEEPERCCFGLDGRDAVEGIVAGWPALGMGGSNLVIWSVSV